MKTLITNYRYWMLTLIAATGILFLVATPSRANNTFAYIGMLATTKLIAVAAFTLFGKLFVQWQREGKINELSDLCKDE